MMQTGNGQWIWRPLTNPRELRVNRFMDESPRGFGLIQRERDFQQYQDLDSQYEARPSYWVQPLGAWGKGGVELVEIPSDEEIHDNVVAYWVPAEAPVAGKPLNFLVPSVSLLADGPVAARRKSDRHTQRQSDVGRKHASTLARELVAYWLISPAVTLIPSKPRNRYGRRSPPTTGMSRPWR